MVGQGFDSDVLELSIKRMGDETSAAERTKDRASNIFGFCLIVLTFSPVVVGLYYDVTHSLNGLQASIIAGSSIILVSMFLSYLVMIFGVRIYTIDPQKLYEIYNTQKYTITIGVIRETMFDSIKKMEKSNDSLSRKLNAVYILFPVGTAIMFIPVMYLLIIK